MQTASLFITFRLIETEYRQVMNLDYTASVNNLTHKNCWWLNSFFFTLGVGINGRLFLGKINGIEAITNVGSNYNKLKWKGKNVSEWEKISRFPAKTNSSPATKVSIKQDLYTYMVGQERKKPI